MRAAMILCVFLAGCATMVKPDMTEQSKAQDRYACEKEAFDSHAGIHTNQMYRDCMKARGYK